MPMLIASFMTSYFDATDPNTPLTRPAFSSSGTVSNPKCVVFSLMGLAL